MRDFRTSMLGILAMMALLLGALSACDDTSEPAEPSSAEFEPSVVAPEAPAEETAVEEAVADEPAETDAKPVDQVDGQADEQIREVRLEPAPTRAEHLPGQSSTKREPEEWKSAVLQIVTNFEKADVTVNGLAYPEYADNGEEPGMVLPAGGPHKVQVTYDGKTKTYRIYLRPEETRLLMVELSGFQGGSAAPAPRRRVQQRNEDREREQEDEEEDESQGRVTVYSKPKGEVLIDGGSTGERTPGTVEVDPGRHEVQVRFEGGEESEKKIIRVRSGSRIKLFFRQKND